MLESPWGGWYGDSLMLPHSWRVIDALDALVRLRRVHSARESKGSTGKRDLILCNEPQTENWQLRHRGPPLTPSCCVGDPFAGSRPPSVSRWDWTTPHQCPLSTDIFSCILGLITKLLGRRERPKEMECGVRSEEGRWERVPSQATQAHGGSFLCSFIH